VGYREFWHRKNEWMGLDYWRCGNINEGPERYENVKGWNTVRYSVMWEQMKAPRTER
jgi:hypothetical protein